MLLWVGLVVVVGAGCFHPCGATGTPGDQGAACDTTDDCADGLVCDVGCVDEVSACRGTCTDENDPNALCRTGVTCSAGAPCEDGSVCRQGWCQLQL